MSRAGTCSTALPKNIEITSEEVREALSDPVNQILDTIRSTLEKTPRPSFPPTSSTAASCLRAAARCCAGLDKLISIETKIPVHVAENPLDCVVDGCGKCLENDARACRDRQTQLRLTKRSDLRGQKTRRNALGKQGVRHGFSAVSAMKKRFKPTLQQKT